MSLAPQEPPQGRRSPLFIIFTTVAMDLVGFGMIVTLVGQYGKELGASGFELGLLGASYSLAQFFFAPLWGRLSDRHGRRPILLMSLFGSAISYSVFGVATLQRNLFILIFARLFQGAFAANLSAAQAYIADVTPKEKRAIGMGLIGAAFGLGFVCGPMIGGLAANRLGLAWPGFIASGICLVNALLAVFRLPESLPIEIQEANRQKAARRYDPLNLEQIRQALVHPFLGLLILMYFVQIFAFSNIEQTFGLLIQTKFQMELGPAAEKTGLLLGFVGLLAGLIQGLGLRQLVPRLGERRMLVTGTLLFAASIAFIPFGPSYSSYFILLLPMAVGRSLIDPSMSALISKCAAVEAQGETFGLTQGLGSLARATGPFCGLLSFAQAIYLPFAISAFLGLSVFGMSLILYLRSGSVGLDARQSA